MSAGILAPAGRVGRIDTKGERVVRVALAGCGTVGGELVRLVHRGAAEIRARHGIRFELVRVLVAHPDRPRPDELDRGLLTTDVDSFLGTEADLVVEAIGGMDPAHRIARETLAAGRRLVTANKALLAVHGPDLVRLARKSRGRLDFESAVMGGVPVLRALREPLSLTGIRRVQGILNGTTNYILSRIEDGWTFAAALAEAQARGFAEADPARDLSGEDAADKVRILAWLAFGAHPARLQVRRRGLGDAPERLAQAARGLEGTVRLVAEAERVPGGVAASVEPVLVSPSSDLGRTRDEENALVVESEWNGRVRLAGPGAGGSPTASALLGDMVRSAVRQRLPAAGEAGGVADRRSHAWAVAIDRFGQTAGDVLARTLSRAGINNERLTWTKEVVVIRTEPVTWARVGLAVRALEGQGLAPAVLRVGDGV